MCLYPRKMVNKKYTPTKKNGGCIPMPPVISAEDIYDENTGEIYRREIKYDERVLEVQIPCGKCIECRQAKARNWAIRLEEEIPETEHNYFMTLTFSPEGLGKLRKKTGLNECNALFGIALRRSLERWRKDHKKSLKHWFITELGHEGTERIHAHGIFFSNEPLEFKIIEQKQDGIMAKWKYWNYGHVFVGTYVSMRTVNYLMKYVTKIDLDHKHFNGYIFCSPGIGKAWLEKMQNAYKYIPGESLDYVRLPNGSKVKIPTYYKNHCYNEEEREKIWIDFMNKGITTIAGNTYHDEWQQEAYGRITEKAQEMNKRNGYGDDSNEWKNMPWNVTPAMLRKNEDKVQKILKADTAENIRILAKEIMERNRQKALQEKLDRKQARLEQKIEKQELLEKKRFWKEIIKDKPENMIEAEKKYKKIRRKLRKNLEISK